MKTESNFIDYGVYIDRKKSFIISLNHVIHEAFMEEDIHENEEVPVESTNVRHQVDVQNHKNEQLKKFCRSIIAKLENAHNILIFGPSVSKFELQKEIINVKHLKQARRQLMTTDLMEKESALRFVKHHYTPIIVGQEIFVMASKN